MPEKVEKKQHTPSSTESKEGVGNHKKNRKSLGEVKVKGRGEVRVSKKTHIMSSPERKHSPEEAAAIAVRLSVDDAARGEKPIWELAAPAYVTRVANDLVFIFSSSRWPEVEHMLQDARVQYHYQRAMDFSRQMLDDPAAWKAIGVTPTKMSHGQ